MTNLITLPTNIQPGQPFEGGFYGGQYVAPAISFEVRARFVRLIHLSSGL